MRTITFLYNYLFQSHNTDCRDTFQRYALQSKYFIFTISKYRKKKFITVLKKLQKINNFRYCFVKLQYHEDSTFNNNLGIKIFFNKFWKQKHCLSFMTAYLKASLHSDKDVRGRSYFTNTSAFDNFTTGKTKLINVYGPHFFGWKDTFSRMSKKQVDRILIKG